MKWTHYNGAWCVWRDGAYKPVEEAPVQAEDSVPMEVAAEAFKEYSARYGGQTLKRLCERGGFGAAEMALLLYCRIKRLEQELAVARADPQGSDR